MNKNIENSSSNEDAPTTSALKKYQSSETVSKVFSGSEKFSNTLQWFMMGLVAAVFLLSAVWFIVLGAPLLSVLGFLGIGAAVLLVWLAISLGLNQVFDFGTGLFKKKSSNQDSLETTPLDPEDKK